jgi:hypothetical protein
MHPSSLSGKGSSMQAFLEYVVQVENLIHTLLSTSSFTPYTSQIDATLNGGPSTELRKSFDIQALRETGTFFTSKDLAQTLLVEEKAALMQPGKILDPACGGGDLLLACTKFLPLSKDKQLTSTLYEWGQKLAGTDINPAFIKLTKERLVLAAIYRGARQKKGTKLDFDDIFPYIREGNGLEDANISSGISLVLMNPPYSYMKAPICCSDWTSGKVSAAAVFLEKYVTTLELQAHVAAILPEVLRTGRRYEKWRKKIEQKSSLRRVTSIGLFDKSVDIDVFILRLIVGKPKHSKKVLWWTEHPSRKISHCLGDFFEVRVGSVVPHRDPLEGPEYPYFHARSIPPWETISVVESTRQHQGTVFTPPFVVVRRTSRPGDHFRAVGAIINIKGFVAIENHLLVLLPKDGKKESCERLLSYLQSEQANNWLNERIRCRHLTVSAVSEMPIQWD